MKKLDTVLLKQLTSICVSHSTSAVKSYYDDNRLNTQEGRVLGRTFSVKLMLGRCLDCWMPSGCHVDVLSVDRENKQCMSDDHKYCRPYLICVRLELFRD